MSVPDSPPSDLAAPFTSVADVVARLEAEGYLADDGLAMSVFLAVRMRRPLFLEGSPGVGKTLLATVLARVFRAELIRLQCYEGIDVSQAVYEWNYTRQLLELQSRTASAGEVFREAFLLKRPLLRAIDAANDRSPVLLIDEIDRADEEFESFLLELLSDFQVTIPELGTVRARHAPVVVLTSNRTRDVHVALKRRCIFHWIDYPSFEKEVAIVRRRVPSLGARLAGHVVAFTQQLRREELTKVPGVAETVDWAEALAQLGAADAEELDEKTVSATLGLLLKYQDDVARVRSALGERLRVGSA
jgi:MoxR-like ATPase